MENLATHMSNLLKRAAPNAYANMLKHFSVDNQCRIGKHHEKVWSGCTAVMDFSAHSHTDFRNQDNVATLGLTLTNDESRDSQLHVLTRYKPSQINSEEAGLGIALENGACLIEVAKVC